MYECTPQSSGGGSNLIKKVTHMEKFLWQFDTNERWWRRILNAELPVLVKRFVLSGSCLQGGANLIFPTKKTQKAWFVSIKTKGRYWIGRRTFCLLICVSSVLIGSQETSPGPAVSVGLFYCRIYRLALLSYLIFDFVCLTLSFADTHGITKYARTYIQRYTHTRTHKKKKKKGEKKKKKM